MHIDVALRTEVGDLVEAIRHGDPLLQQFPPHARAPACSAVLNHLETGLERPIEEGAWDGRSCRGGRGGAGTSLSMFDVFKASRAASMLDSPQQIIFVVEMSGLVRW